MNAIDHFVGVDFYHFKAFKSFSIELRPFNILVGPNNAGKSTILAAFRILAAALRRADTRRAEMIRGPLGLVYGHKVDLSSISVAEENIFYNYDDDEPASVTFGLSNGNRLALHFPEQNACNLFPDAQGRDCITPSTFRQNFRCSVGFVPILGPVEHKEPLYKEEAARLALFNYRASRNFRNIWYHYPGKFPEFREAIRRTWPGMDIERPETDTSHEKVMLYMYCPEERIPREIFWSGFGFQVWCQMLTHVIQSNEVSLFLIDEPDIYLHADLQRQLLGILHGLGPDILIATHSTDIITEAETDDIVIVNKKKNKARRIRNPSQLAEVFNILGSNVNPILTQLAKTRKAIFVEGKDFQILGKFARKLGYAEVGNQSKFAVVPVGGFSAERIKNLKDGMEMTLGIRVLAGAVLDRDYRSAEECQQIVQRCKAFCDFARIHQRKEIENFLLVPSAIDRAAAARAADRARRTGSANCYDEMADGILTEFAEEKRHDVMGQYLASRRRYEREQGSGLDDATLNLQELSALEERWNSDGSPFEMIPGKEALSHVNRALQEAYGINVTPTGIIDAMHSTEVPDEVRLLVETLSEFSALDPG